MKTPRQLTTRVCPANSRVLLSRNFTEMGRSSENRRVVRFSGCGCAMLGLQILWIVGTILAYVPQFCWIFWPADIIYLDRPATKHLLKHRGKEVAEEAKRETKDCAFCIRQDGCKNFEKLLSCGNRS
jgi:hypothetical protein